MSADDQRNTLIFEMAKHSNQTNYQSFSDTDLAGVGALMVFLLKTGIRTAAQLKTISADDQRNIMIVEIDGSTHLGQQLQGLTNIELVLLGLGKNLPGSLDPSSFIRGVLLAGGFRTHHELIMITADDMRNILIVELAGHSNQPVAHFQSLNDFDLAGAGAAMVFLLKGGIRDASQLKTISDDDQRNIAIVEVGGQTHLGARLQGLRTFDVVATALGVDPAFFVAKPPLDAGSRPYRFIIESVEAKVQKADNDHSDSDWLSLIVSIGNAATKDQPRVLPAQTFNIGGNIKSGNVLVGPFKTDPFDVEDGDVVVITYVLTNLGSSDIEDQGKQAVQVTDKVVGIAGPVVGAAIGLFLGAPGEGAQIGEQIAQGIDKAIGVLSDVFDFLGLHFGPPNCNGVVVNDSLTFLPGELAQAAGRPASRQYTGSQQNDRCGDPPQTTVNYLVRRHAGMNLGDPNF
jgi:hypothetical protein